jgi:hypothetical protein
LKKKKQKNFCYFGPRVVKPARHNLAKVFWFPRRTAFFSKKNGFHTYAGYVIVHPVALAGSAIEAPGTTPKMFIRFGYTPV